MDDMKSAYSYTAYGLRLEAPQPLPDALSLIPTPACADVRLEIKAPQVPRLQLPCGASLDGSCWTSRSVVRRREDGYTVAIDWTLGRTMFSVDARGRHVVMRPQAERSLTNELSVFLHPTLAFVARLQGRVCLHANVMVVNGRAIALAGVSGVGKSTLSAALHRRGAVVWADDVAAMTSSSGQVQVHAGVRRLRVGRATAHALGWEAQDQYPVFEPHGGITHEKVYLGDAPAEEGMPAPLPLHRVYLLQPRRSDLRAPCIEAVPPALAPARLAMQRSVIEGEGRERVASTFHFLADVARTVPVRALTCPDDVSRLGEICEMLQEDVAREDVLRKVG